MAGAARGAIVTLLAATTLAGAAFADDGGGQGAPHPHMHHRFEDARRWARIFDAPGRDRWQKPEQVIAALGLPKDAVVADLGAGTGYFAMRLARALPAGRVYAVDIEPAMVRFLGERAGKEGLGNVQPVLCTADDSRLPAAVDLVLVVDTYHHIDHRVEYFRRLRERLRPGGRVAIIDFRKGAPKGPPDAARIPEAQVVAELTRAGYRVLKSPTFLPYQHFVILQ
jgi:SAM-dependent methyltransferase